MTRIPAGFSRNPCRFYEGILQVLVGNHVKTEKKPTIADGILALLGEGEKRTSEIYKAIEGKKKSIDACLSRLVTLRKIVRVDTGLYRLPTASDAPVATENSRGEAENTETINKMLNLYDQVIDTAALTIAEKLSSATNIEDLTDMIKSLRWLGATVDQLMKRWYLVHRGYDSNTKQAHEDAKQKTVDREKQEVEQLPPEKRIKVIRSYDATMKELINRLPGKIDHKV